jgi:hypothetical protein
VNTVNRMDLMTIGADVAQMVAAGAVVTAGPVWIRKQLRERRRTKAARQLRDWNGYIPLNAISSWYVRVTEEPDTPTSRVVLEVLRSNGEPDPNMAYSLRQWVDRDGMLARVPTEEEYDFLKALHKERGYGGGFIVE